MSLHGTLRDSALSGSALRDPALPPHSASDASAAHSVAKKPLRHRSVAAKRSAVNGRAANGLWLSIGTVIILVAVWWAVTALQLISPLFLPAPQQVLHQLRVIASAQGFMDATLWQHLSASLGRILVALFAAVALGVPTGIAMGHSPNRGVAGR